MGYFRTALLLVIVLLGTGVRAQILDPSETGGLDPDDPNFDPTTARRASPQEQREVLPDTFGILLYRADNPNVEERFRDSLLPGFQRFEPDRATAFDYGTLGQLGSASYPLRYQPVRRKGLELGLRQFDLYKVTAEELSYYRLERPFTYLHYIRGSEQEDGMLQARFSRNFADGVNLVLHYDRIFQLGEQDQYPGMAVRNTAVVTGLSVRPPGSRYSGYFSFAANTFENVQNGGIADLGIDNEVIENEGSARPFMEVTNLRHADREVAATQYLQFGAALDTLTGRERRAFTLSHRLRYRDFAYRMTTDRTIADTSFYTLYPLLDIDPRGLRSRATLRTVSNAIGLATFRRTRSAESETVQKDLLEVGLTHQLHWLDREVSDSTLNYVIATASVGLRPSDRLQLRVDGQLNLLGQIGDYRVAAQGTLDLGVAGKLELGAVNQLYAPDLLLRKYVLNGASYYDRDFGKTLEFRLEGAYTLPFIGIRAGLGYSLLTDYIYIDAEGLPRQSGGPHSILQLTAERNLVLGSFRLDNRVLLQEVDREVFRLPRLYGEHSFYYAGKWFGVLNVNLGVDLRYSSGFEPYYYNPVLQQFQLQDRQRTDFYAQVDPFFSLRVTRFRFFVQFVQAQTLLFDELLYTTATYPYPDGALRLGASWRLLD